MAASYISVPRDLTKVKNKVMFNLTKRQLICFGVAALVGVPSFFLLKSVMEVNTAVMGMMVIMMPFFFLAMYERNGQPLEVILTHMIQTIFIRPKTRPYKTDNYYAALIRQADAERKVEEIVRTMEKEKQKGVFHAPGLKQSRADAGATDHQGCAKE
ncbi:MAG: PrgI family protein [Lachnospiraceae bacterium]|nr:PrgI family protein [Lachnospiraceae bacterium]